MSGLEMVAVAVTALAIWLTARRHMLCWPLNVLACALYFKLFLDVRLYADMVLQALFGLAILYGWREWARAPAQAGQAWAPVRKGNPRKPARQPREQSTASWKTS